MRILKEGFPFIVFPAIAGIALIGASGLAFGPLAAIVLAAGLILCVFSVFCVFFFRDPKIKITGGKGVILSPCNGTVIEITEGDEKIIRVFLSIFSVHLQRSPISGKIIEVSHKDGKFYKAWDSRAQALNEQNSITVESENGVYIVRQIAGFLARRCVSWVKPGDIVGAGDKIGMIKFSSQVDLHLPAGSVFSVKTGEKVRAGITVIGKII